MSEIKIGTAVRRHNQPANTRELGIVKSVRMNGGMVFYDIAWTGQTVIERACPDYLVTSAAPEPTAEAQLDPHDGVHGDSASGPGYFAPEHERDVMVVDAKGEFFTLKADDQLDAEKLAAIWRRDGARSVQIVNPSKQ